MIVLEEHPDLERWCAENIDSPESGDALLAILSSMLERERLLCVAICKSNAELQATRARVENNPYAAERAVEAEKCATQIRARTD